MSYGLPRIGLAVIAMLIVAAAPVSASEKPATRPASTAPASSTWPALFAELASADQQTRDTARATLMRLTRADLPALRELVDKSRPILPAQSAALREIVQEIYLGGEPYMVEFLVQGTDRSDGKEMTIPVEAENVARAAAMAGQKIVVARVTPIAGFLGIVMGDSTRGGDTGLDNDGHYAIGVVVSDRFPGFGAARNLIDGDIILGIASPFTPFRSSLDLTNAIRPSPPGAMVGLVVLRRGQVINVTLTLDPKPASHLLDDDVGVTFRAERQKRFDAYWEANFKPLISQQLG